MCFCISDSIVSAEGDFEHRRLQTWAAKRTCWQHVATILVLLPVTFGGDVDELLKLLNGDPSNQLQALNQISRSVQANAEDGISKDDLTRLLNAVGQLPLKTDNFKVLDFAWQLFVQNRITSGPATEFAFNHINREINERNLPHWDSGIRFVRTLGIKDERFKNAFTSNLSKLPHHLLPETIRYLGEHYSDDPGVGRAAASLLLGADNVSADYALRYFGALKLKREDARKLVQKAIKTFEADKIQLTWQYLNNFTSQPEIYGGSLSSEETTYLLKTLEEGKPDAAETALMLLLACGREKTQEYVVPLFLKRFGKAKPHDVRILMLLGFIQTQKLSDAVRKEILATIFSGSAPTRDESMAGLTSLFLRSGPDTIEYLKVVEKFFPNFITLHQWAYWRSLRGFICEDRVPPKMWKQNWDFFKDDPKASEDVIASARVSVFTSIPCHPDAPQTRWAFEQVIKEKALPDNVLQALYHASLKNPELGDIPGLKEWITMAASNHRLPENRFLATRIPAELWGEKEESIKLAKAAMSATSRGNWWTEATEVILDHSKEFQEIALLRGALGRGIQSPQGAGAPGATGGQEFLVWLLDVRIGKKVKSPPTESLREAFRRPDALSWIAGLKKCGSRITKSHLTALRSPGIVLKALDPKVMQTYLGAIDALELGL